MNIVFFGSTEFGYECCEALMLSGNKIVGIFTIDEIFNISNSPNKPVKNYLFKDFRELGDRYKIPVISINGNLRSYKTQLEALQPDFLLAVGWYYLIPDELLGIAKFGGAGIHASLLPKYRGNAPLVWAMINGENKTGVSFFYFSKGVDEGDIIAQKSFTIEETDSIKEVLSKAKGASIDILLEFVPLIASSTAPRIPQNHQEATYYPSRTPEDGLINWEWDSNRIQNFIRAQTRPYPGAFFCTNNKKITIWEATIEKEDS